MNELPAAPPIFAQPWAVRFGFTLLAGLTLVVGLTFFDGTRRAELESISETTAVGDVKYFQPPADLTRLPVAGATLNGQPLVVASMEEIGVRDTHLHRVAVDAASGLAIYKLSAAATAEDHERVGETGAYLLKLSPNEYVRAQPAAP